MLTNTDFHRQTEFGIRILSLIHLTIFVNFVNIRETLGVNLYTV